MQADGAVAVATADAHVAPGGANHLDHLSLLVRLERVPQLVIELEDDAARAAVARAGELGVDVIYVGLNEVRLCSKAEHGL